MDTWLSGESKRGESSQGSRTAVHKLNSIKARLRNARSEVYCTLQVRLFPTALDAAFILDLVPHLVYALCCLLGSCLLQTIMQVCY